MSSYFFGNLKVIFSSFLLITKIKNLFSFLIKKEFFDVINISLNSIAKTSLLEFLSYILIGIINIPGKKLDKNLNSSKVNGSLKSTK